MTRACRTAGVLGLAIGLIGAGGIAACGVFPGDSGGGGAPARSGRVLSVVRHDVHEQCPLLVAHPSVHGVTSQAQWAQMLAQSRMLPPPYDARQTDFSRHTIVLVALPTSPHTALMSLAGPEAVRWHEADQRLEVTVRAAKPPPDPTGTTRSTTVMASPCLVAWLPALPGLRQVVAFSADGQVIARSGP